MFIAVAIEILGIPVLPVAIGLYLPLELSATIMVGGVVRYVIDRKASDKDKKNEANGGILFASGMIAGEGLVGILLAILTVFGLDAVIDMSGFLDTGIIGGIVLLLVMVGLIYHAGSRRGTKN